MGAKLILRSATRCLGRIARPWHHAALLLLMFTWGDGVRCRATAQTVAADVSVDATAARDTSARTAPAFPSPAVRHWQLGLLRADRLQHASVSFAIAAGVGVVREDRATAAGVSLGLGLLKECWDARTGRFDIVDVIADATGALLGARTTRPR